MLKLGFQFHPPTVFPLLRSLPKKLFSYTNIFAQSLVNCFLTRLENDLY